MTSTTAVVILGSLAFVLAGCDASSIGPPPPVTVTSVSPAVGPLSGGTMLTIMGTNFTDVASLTIGGGELGGRTVVSATHITGTAQASSSPGLKDVIATSSHGSGT